MPHMEITGVAGGNRDGMDGTVGLLDAHNVYVLASLLQRQEPNRRRLHRVLADHANSPYLIVYRPFTRDVSLSIPPPVVGSMVVTWLPSYALLLYLVIEPIWRGRGIARASLDCLWHLAAERGLSRLCVGLDGLSESAVAFYRAVGFQAASCLNAPFAYLERDERPAGERATQEVPRVALPEDTVPHQPLDGDSTASTRDAARAAAIPIPRSQTR
jgi:GNAT superfamily N-acetyltransferase